MAGTTIRTEAGKAAGAASQQGRLQELGKFFESGFRLEKGESRPFFVMAMTAIALKSEAGARTVEEVCAAAEFIAKRGLIKESITTLRSEALRPLLKEQSEYPGFFLSALKASGHPALRMSLDESLLANLLEANRTIINSTWNGTRELAGVAFLAMLENAGCRADWITADSAFKITSVTINIRATDASLTEARMGVLLPILRGGAFSPARLGELMEISAHGDPLQGLGRFS